MNTENKNTVKKLQLNKRTIVMLNEQSMVHLNGGTQGGRTDVGASYEHKNCEITANPYSPECQGMGTGKATNKKG